MGTRPRRLDDHIRELCTAAVAASSPEELDAILSELRVAIHEYTVRLRRRAALLLCTHPEFPQERRKA